MKNLRPRFLVSGSAVSYHSSGILNLRGVGFITKADLEYSDTVWLNLKRTFYRQPTQFTYRFRSRCAPDLLCRSIQLIYRSQSMHGLQAFSTSTKLSGLASLSGPFEGASMP